MVMIVLQIPAIPALEDADMKKFVAMMAIIVLLILAIPQLDVITPKLSVMITMTAPPTLVYLLLVATTRK
jgi:hypothetical protein